jgi:hypothetical protein|tara:strand:- start:34091 stop:34276 length:186 start_codon:yes stop_codon:yes gene_type:complete
MDSDEVLVTSVLRKRKSLAVDQHTYDLLEEICAERGHTRIEALKRLIQAEHDRVFDSVAHS